jgi:hypothetical protein
MKKIFIMLFITFTYICYGTDLYVNADMPDNSGDGITPETAWKYISSAIANGKNFDVINLKGVFTLSDEYGNLIDPGVIINSYSSGLQIINKSLTFRGVSSSSTIIQACNKYDKAIHRAFYIEGYTSESIVVFENLTIRKGRGEPSGGICAIDLKLLKFNNCIIDSNKTWNDPSFIANDVQWTKYRGGGAILANRVALEINNSIIKDNVNIAREGGLGGEGGGICFFPWYTYTNAFLRICNSAIINCSTPDGPGGGISIQSGAGNTTIDISNTTFKGNEGKDGHAIYMDYHSLYGTDLDVRINSCTLSDNLPDVISSNTSALLLTNFVDIESASFDIRNSIVKNYNKDITTGFTNQNISPTDLGVNFTRSYTISDDVSIPLTAGIGNFNDIDPKITLGKAVDPVFYKLLAGSPAKDAIPRGDFSSYPYYNGAGVEFVTADMDTTSLDQRGFVAWNQSKDIGAYESPYYWVDVADKKEYETIPNWKTELTIADPVEGWTDYMRAQTGGKIILTENSEIERLGSSELKWNDGSFMDVNANSRIINGLDFVSGASINVLDDAQLSLQLTNATISTNTTVTIGKNAKLIVENGSNLTIEDGTVIELAEGAEIIVKNKGNLTADGTTFSYTGVSGKWLGINCEGGSSVDLDNVKITGALTGVSGVYNNKFNVTNSIFEGCDNGISVTELVPTTSYVITNNTLTGTRAGTGVSITSSNGVLKNNTISFFLYGARFTMCSPTVSKNTIFGNKVFGILVSGQNSIPQLINPDLNQVPFPNNEIYSNGGTLNSPSDLFLSAQIGIIPYANVYMHNGKNNIYSGIVNTTPNVPCISIAKLIAGVNQNIIVKAAYNYWGSSSVNYDFFFEDHYQYAIEYTPYYVSPDGLVDPDDPNSQSSSTENQILTNAIRLESKENVIPVIKLYEHIIKKYVDTPEYYIALARLPYLYALAELDNNELIAIYDEALLSENTTNKKFFKGMKVATHIKGKRYDAAISVAEEMKNEAEFEEEITLADINITVANMLKDMESKSRNSIDYAQNLRDLQAKLTENESKTEPSGITENVLPSVSTLYQNYPNPFNPVTQIKFALAKNADVKLNVYNISGQKVAELENGSKNAGFHTVDFDGSRFNSGVYYYSLEIDGKSITKKMVLTK